jgi:hypothetical protein
MSAIDIDKDIQATSGPDAIGYSTGTKHLRETQITPNSEPPPTSIEDECQTPIDKTILLALAEESFASVRRTASKTEIPRTTVHCHLVGPLSMTVKRLRWVLHRLSAQQSVSRVQKAQELTELSEIARQVRNKTQRQFSLHMDNARPHTAKSSIKFCASQT